METNENKLYPIFLKPKELEILIIGGGWVAEEKLTFLLKSSPDAKVTMVAPIYRKGTLEVAGKGKVDLVFDEYHSDFLRGKHLVIACTDLPSVNKQVFRDCRERNTLVNVADNPPYCDFYMGGIVTKGNVKVAISTNGKSPTTAKRLRQFFEEVLPENIDDLVENLNTYRKSIGGSFEKKVSTLNELTKSLVE